MNKQNASVKLPDKTCQVDVLIILFRWSFRFHLDLIRTSQHTSLICNACICTYTSYLQRYIHRDPMCSVAMGHANDGDSVNDKDLK